MIVVTGSSQVSPFRGPLIPDRAQRKSAVRPKKASLTTSFKQNEMLSVAPWPSSWTMIYFFWAAVCILSLSMHLLAQDPTPAAAGSNSALQDELVHYGDVIDVDVVGGFEFDWRGTITPEGHLDGLETFDAPIFALCRTESEIAADVARAYSKILRDPKVIVRIIDRSNRALARVDGAVRTPTRFSIRREVTLNELLVLAGGFVSGASGEIMIFRPANLSCSRTEEPPGSPGDNRSQTTIIKISDLLSGRVSSDPVILSGDIVTVSKAFPIYVIGAVNNPGSIYLTSELTLSRAIATVGGMAKDADGKTATIFRRSGAGTSIIDVDLAKIKRGEMEDEVLRSFDIIDVPAKGGGKRTYPPASPSTGIRDPTWAQMPLKIVE